MNFYYTDHNVPTFYTKEFKKHSNKPNLKEWTTEEDIKNNHSKYSIKGKANIIGYISKETSKRITNTDLKLFVVTLVFMFIYVLPDGCCVTY